MTLPESAGSDANETIRRAIYRGALGGTLLAIAFLGGYLLRGWILEPPSPSATFDLVSEVDVLLANNFVGEFPSEQLRAQAAAKGLAESLNDPYTYFVEPQTAEIDNDRLAGSFGGIGVEIERDDQGRFAISKVYPDNPAAQANVRLGDIIVAVDGTRIDSSSPDDNELLPLIQGTIGDKVKLTLERNGVAFDVEIVRAQITTPAVFWRRLDEDARIGYIQITSFTDHAPDETKQAIVDLRGQGVKALVLDLRGNGGGLVESSVSVAGQFLNGGPILFERSRRNDELVFNAPLGGAALDEPLVALVNANTASAAEIVAGALQDRRRALIIGQTTYGKGSVQTILPLSDGSALHVTTAEWYTPNHHRLQGEGLTPDIETRPVDGKDAELAAAIEHLVALLSALP